MTAVASTVGITIDTLPVPSKEAVPSVPLAPALTEIFLAVCNLVAELALPVTLPVRLP